MPRSRSPAMAPAPAVRAISGTISMMRFSRPAAVRPKPAKPYEPEPASDMNETATARAPKAIV